jgi:protocatechuate 3,4-dioxygenase beta subunit
MAVRLSPLNLALLFVTALALIFGAWGMYQGAEKHAPRPENHLAATGGDATSGQHDDERHRNDDARPTRDRNARPSGAADAGTTASAGTLHAAADSVIPDVTAAGQPLDSGDATITGVVLHADGRPAEAVAVMCRRTDLNLNPPPMRNGNMDEYREKVIEFLQQTATETRRTATDKEGKFAFHGLDPTLSYDLHALEDAGGSGRLSRVAAGDTTRILLSVAGKLRGKVVGPDGSPVTTFTIKAWPTGRQWETRTETFKSEDGTFNMDGGGRMQVEASADGFSMESAMDIDVKDDGPEVVLQLQQGATMSGTVTDTAGKPLAQALVTIGTGNDEEMYVGYWGRNQGPRAYTDTKGRYRLASLKVGEIAFRASLGQTNSTQTVNLVAGENTLNFTIDVGVSLALRLTDPEGKPVAADSVWFQSDERNWSNARKLPASEPGLVEYIGLNPGEYTLTITAAGFPPIRQKKVLEKGRNELSLKLTNGAMLSGKVTTTSGAALQASARLRNESDQDGGWGLGRNALLKSDGTYKIGPVEPGQWTMELYPQNHGQPLYKTILTLNEGENTHNFSVDTGATLLLRVTDQQGNPVARAQVQVRGERNQSGAADAGGLATIPFLTAGVYTVTATAAGLASQPLQLSLGNGENSYSLQLAPPNAARITHVYPDSQAAKVGLQVGDLIIEYNGKEITSWSGFSREARSARGAGDLTIIVDRNGASLTFALKGGTVGVEGVDAVR